MDQTQKSKNMTTKETLIAYYNGIALNSGWQDYLADDMFFFSPAQTSTGKEAYVTATLRFFKWVNGAEVKELIIEGDAACALVSYSIVAPSGNRSTCEVAEILSVKAGKIQSSKIFFDTAAFRRFAEQG